MVPLEESFSVVGCSHIRARRTGIRLGSIHGLILHMQCERGHSSYVEVPVGDSMYYLDNLLVTRLLLW